MTSSNTTNQKCSLVASILVAASLLGGGSTAFAAAAEEKVPEKTTRIVGGSLVTDPSDYPFFAFWEVGCGASLIHEDILLTAAHCDQPDQWFSSTTTVYIDSLSPYRGTQRSVVDRELHPDYNARSNHHDFMLLKLNAPIRDIKPVPMATTTSNDDPVLGDKITVIGVGAELEGDGLTDQLREVTLDFVPHDTCSRQYRGLFGSSSIDEESEFCTGVLDGNDSAKDSCQGDSGGPVLDANGVQIGVVSWGNGCAREGFSGVNARVSDASEWIQSQICQLSSNPPADCSEADLNPPAPPPPPSDEDDGGGVGDFFDWLFGLFG